MRTCVYACWLYVNIWIVRRHVLRMRGYIVMCDDRSYAFISVYASVYFCTFIPSSTHSPTPSFTHQHIDPPIHPYVCGRVGHVYNTDFVAGYESWDRTDPAVLFSVGVRKLPSDKRGNICRHLQVCLYTCLNVHIIYGIYMLTWYAISNEYWLHALIDEDARTRTHANLHAHIFLYSMKRRAVISWCFGWIVIGREKTYASKCWKMCCPTSTKPQVKGTRSFHTFRHILFPISCIRVRWCFLFASNK